MRPTISSGAKVLIRDHFGDVTELVFGTAEQFALPLGP